jgi:hypothetical protein
LMFPDEARCLTALLEALLGRNQITICMQKQSDERFLMRTLELLCLRSQGKSTSSSA